MSLAFALLFLTTVLYAGYNFLVKDSASHVPAIASSTITATITLQVAALATSLVFAVVVRVVSSGSIWLAPKAYFWAALAGTCIGAAEIAYFYVFSGLGTGYPIRASIAVPFIVSGTILLATLAGWLIAGEPFGGIQLVGLVLIVAGVVLLFVH